MALGGVMLWGSCVVGTLALMAGVVNSSVAGAGEFACCIHIDQIIQTTPGQNGGAMAQGLRARWDADTDLRANICFSDYRGNGRRVVNAPVIPSLGAGRTAVRVIGLAAFFLKQRPTSDAPQAVHVEFVRDLVPEPAGRP